MLKASTPLLSLLTQLRSEKQMWKQLPDIELAPISYILQLLLHQKHHCFFTGKEKIYTYLNINLISNWLLSE